LNGYDPLPLLSDPPQHVGAWFIWIEQCRWSGSDGKI